MHGFTFDDWIPWDAVQCGIFGDILFLCTLFNFHQVWWDENCVCENWAESRRTATFFKSRRSLLPVIVPGFAPPFFPVLLQGAPERSLWGQGSETSFSTQFRCLGRRACFRQTLSRLVPLEPSAHWLSSDGGTMGGEPVMAWCIDSMKHVTSRRENCEETAPVPFWSFIVPRMRYRENQFRLNLTSVLVTDNIARTGRQVLSWAYPCAPIRVDVLWEKYLEKKPSSIFSLRIFGAHSLTK